VHLQEALGVYNPAWTSEVRHRYGPDGRIVAMGYLAQVYWLSGEVEPARELIEQAVARASKTVMPRR